MFYKSFIVVFVAMGICGQPIVEQSLSVGENNLTVSVNPRGYPLQIVLSNGVSCPSSNGSSTVPMRDDYQHTPGIGYHKLHTQPRDWNSARKSCRDEGGHLAIINSLAEAEVLREMLRKVIGTRYPAYVGYHDLYKEGEWTTIFGATLEEAGYTVWEEGEPNNRDGNENCAIFAEQGSLNDMNCDIGWWYICEIPIIPKLH